MTSLAMGAALLLVAGVLPVFNALTGKQMALPFGRFSFLLILTGILLLTALVAGSYPALFLSSLHPVKVLKGTLKSNLGAKRFRQVLVVIQFSLSALLITGSLVVYRQLHLIQHTNLGFDRESLLYVPVEGELRQRYETFKQELLQQPGISEVTRMGHMPTNVQASTMGVQWPGKAPDVKISFTQLAASYDFISTLKLKLLDGRDFSRNFATDSTGYLINETAARAMGLEDPVGQPLTFWGKPGKIIGLLQDFHFTSLHSPINPLIVHLEETFEWGSYVVVRTQPGSTQQAVSSLQQLYKAMNPREPFAYFFADDQYQKLYQSEQLIGQLAKYFAFLGVFISCLGLLGLAAFTAEQRTKEIGIRKVLGASVGNIIALLTSDYLKLVMLSLLLAIPLAWYALSKWLESFAYRIPLTGWVFALAGGIALLVALLTVSFQSVKAALANPVKSLRSE
jgi:hypothetical protein